MNNNNEKINRLSETCVSLGKVGLLIIENKKNENKIIEEAENVLTNLDFIEGSDYVEIMDLISNGRGKIFYNEKGEKLDGLVLEIVAEFESGIISLADRKNKTGLKTVQFNPLENSLIIIITREKLEKSYAKLFDLVHFTQTL